MTFDALIIGGGAAGLSCALVLGSAKEKTFAKGKSIGIITHQKTSHLQNALFNNVLGLEPGTLGKDILENGKQQLNDLYTHITQIENEKAIAISKDVETDKLFYIKTNKKLYKSKIVVVAIGYTELMTLNGLNHKIGKHPRAKADKNRIWLKNTDHLIEENLYVAGTLAGWRSQFAIACGSGSHVATDILTLWNDGKHTKVHDKI